MRFHAIWKAERLKLRRSPVWLAFFILPLFPAFFGTVNYLGNLELLTSEWYSLWTQHTLFSCYFFLPLLAGILCAYLWRLEHSAHNWNQTLTMPVSKFQLVCAKLAVVMVQSTGMLLWTFVLYFVSGKLCGLTAPLPPELLEWFVCGWCGTLVVCTLQLFLALVIRSFAVPVGIAMAGGVIGLSAMAKGYGLYVPYSLLCLGMRANNPNRELDYVPFFISCAVFAVIFTALSVAVLQWRDAKTG